MGETWRYEELALRYVLRAADKADDCPADLAIYLAYFKCHSQTIFHFTHFAMSAHVGFLFVTA